MARLHRKMRGAAMRPLLFVLALSAGEAIAADSDGNFAIKGAGLQTCGAFVASFEARSTDLGLYGGWIDGFLTGQNQYLDGIFDLAAWETTQVLLGLTHSSCSQLPPETRFIDGFAQVMRVLRPNAIPEQTGASTARLGDSAVALYDIVMIRMKASLVERGYIPGDVESATFTSETAAALKAFQADSGLTESGLPDQQTLYTLFN